jgi:hypothetical protein
MAKDWNKIAQRVDNGLKKVGSTDAGFTATLSQTTVTGGNPWDPGSGTTTTVNTNVTIVVSEYAVSEIDGTTIQAGDRKVLMTAIAGVEPKPSDVLTISGTAYTVINAMPLAPAGVAVMYEVQARSG